MVTKFEEEMYKRLVGCDVISVRVSWLNELIIKTVQGDVIIDKNANEEWFVTDHLIEPIGGSNDE